MTYPCDKCSNPRCTKACVSWIEWFREKWAQLRRVYGREDRP